MARFNSISSAVFFLARRPIAISFDRELSIFDISWAISSFLPLLNALKKPTYCSGKLVFIDVIKGTFQETIKVLVLQNRLDGIYLQVFPVIKFLENGYLASVFCKIGPGEYFQISAALDLIDGLIKVCFSNAFLAAQVALLIVIELLKEASFHSGTGFDEPQPTSRKLNTIRQMILLMGGLLLPVVS